MKEYGYCRISTRKQSMERQVRNILREYPQAHIIQEIYTGTSGKRPEFEKLLRRVRKEKNVRIIFDSVSRMSRNAEEGFLLYQQLFDEGVELVFLKEPHINTETYRNATERSIAQTPRTGDCAADEFFDTIRNAMQRYMMCLAQRQIWLAFEQSQKEVEDLRQRTKEGIETARLAGKQIGQAEGRRLVTKKSIAAKEIIQKHSRNFCGNLSDEECRKLCGCSRNSYYKYKREIKESAKGVY